MNKWAVDVHSLIGCHPRTAEIPTIAVAKFTSAISVVWINTLIAIVNHNHHYLCVNDSFLSKLSLALKIGVCREHNWPEFGNHGAHKNAVNSGN